MHILVNKGQYSQVHQQNYNIMAEKENKGVAKA